MEDRIGISSEFYKVYSNSIRPEWLKSEEEKYEKDNKVSVTDSEETLELFISYLLGNFTRMKFEINREEGDKKITDFLDYIKGLGLKYRYHEYLEEDYSMNVRLVTDKETIEYNNSDIEDLFFCLVKEVTNKIIRYREILCMKNSEFDFSYEASNM